MDTKEIRYNVMLALYLPILLYAFSTFDISEDAYAVQELEPIVVSDESVLLGQPFTGRAFLAVAGSEGQRLEGDEQLGVVGDSVFQMSTASLLEPDEDEKLINYRGRFHFQQVGGQAVEIPVQGRFHVRRPEIVATSEATQSLYRRCLNQVRINVPGLEQQPLVLESGGTSVKGRTITLSPTGEDTHVEVYLADSEAGNVLLGTKRFAAIDPPRPQLRVLNAGREIGNGDNVPRARAMLEFVVDADEQFKRRYPQDARYRVGRATVYLRRGLAASREVGTFDLEDNKLILTRALRDAGSGDRLMIRLENVLRINHAGQAVPVPLNEGSRTFGFVLS